MATFCNMAYTWDANKNKTSESITGGMSGYGFTSAGTTYDNEDLCISSSLPPPASSLLVDIDANGTADVNFQYDALGRHVARSGTGGSVVFVQMDQQTIADYPFGGSATTPTFRYVYASYIDEPVVRKTAGTGGTLVYFHRNQQYSITAVTTSTGSIAERYAYSAYGQPTILDASASVLSSSAINNRYTYTGREWDATLGLHHFRARWMSPSAGRFLTRDPMGFNGSEFNLYEYCSGNPPITTDPLGLFSLVDPWIPQSQIVKAALYAALVAQCQNCDSSDNARTTADPFLRLSSTAIVVAKTTGVDHVIGEITDFDTRPGFNINYTTASSSVCRGWVLGFADTSRRRRGSNVS
jgi:RHS repeat-associated protein